jgi:hypothetical protein
VVFDNDTLHRPDSSSYNSYLVKYNASNGNVLWAKSVNAAPPVTGVMIRGKSVAANSMGDIFFTANYNHSQKIYCGADTVNTPGTQGYFIMKLDTSGHIHWFKANKTLQTCNVRTDESGNAYLDGDYMGNDSLANISLDTVGTKNVFLAKYDANGNAVWAKRGGTPGATWHAMNMKVSGAGDCYMTTGPDMIAPSSTIQFDDSVYTCAGGAFDALALIQVSNNGNVESGIVYNSGGDDFAGVTTDSVGNVYLCGDYFDSLAVPNDTVLYNTATETYFLIKICKHGCSPEKISQIQRGGGFELCPNPVTNTLHLSSNEYLGDIVIYDVTGQRICDRHYNSRTANIDVSSLSKGMYFVKTNNTITKKFVK